MSSQSGFGGPDRAVGESKRVKERGGDEEPSPRYSRELRSETELHAAPGSGSVVENFCRQRKLGAGQGLGEGKLSATVICTCARAKRKAGERLRGGGHPPGELEEWGFPGASLRAETKDGWLHTGE